MEEDSTSLEEELLNGWKDIQPHSRPDESFRAFFKVLLRCKNLSDGKDTTNTIRHFSDVIIKRLEMIGRAQERLKMILNEEIFKKPAFSSCRMPEDEKFDERLDEIALQIRVLEDNLWDLWALLKSTDDESC